MVAARLLMASLMALLATSAALTLSASTQPLRSFSRQRVGVVQLVEPSPEVEASEAAEASPATEAAVATGDTEPETVVVEFSSPFGDKSSPIWQKPKPSSSGLPDKETPAALKLVLDYLCAWLVLERSVRGMVRRRPASSATCLTCAPSLRHRGAFRSRGGPLAAFAMRPLRVTQLIQQGGGSCSGTRSSYAQCLNAGMFKTSSMCIASSPVLALSAFGKSTRVPCRV